ncbi:MAG: gliding motility-associated ABC transporter substrate-binding protein GldG [Bacteroidales bacterium]|nr:gliding motility-associated ABC transporter substrate-binding protein GldG [Bacteroidales bacterium]MCB9013656.1 gliding motility-associated ABC transporter substrate-binding protein GldG [Bacteroidales bacterium]
MNRKNLRNKHFLQLLVTVALLLMINFLAGTSFFRLDMSSEKRFTLNQNTRALLKNLDDVIYVRVFLDGDLPSDLVRFRQSIKEMLLEFRAYGGKNIQFEFVNLYSEQDTKVRNQMMQNLASRGLRVTDVRIKDSEGGYSTKIIFPGAIVSYKGVDFPVNLLKNNPGLSYQVNLNNSVQSLEYEFIRAIKSLTAKKVEKIAFIEGQDELDFYQVNDISSELSLFFQVDRGFINGNLTNLLEYKAIIIAQPLKKFNSRDKFVIDQYIMRGGKVLFFLDPVQTHADSLVSGRTFTEYNDVNLYDLLFKYGTRISYNLIKDLQCNYVRIESSVNGQNPTPSFMPWWYYPIMTASPDNPLTRGLNYIKGEFVSAIDTTSAPIPGLKRTVLLASSDTSALIENPSFISMDEVTRAPNRRIFNKSRLPVAILSEGEFESFYANYGVPEGVTPQNTEIIKKSKPTMIFVAGDGDLIRNDVRVTANGTIPMVLGYDKDTRQTFGNKEFIMNVINYMTDDQGLIALRSREFKLRLLDKTRIRTSKMQLKWKMINTVLPVVVIVLFGVLFNFFRKRKFSKA